MSTGIEIPPRSVIMFSKARVVDFQKGSAQWGYAIKGQEGRRYKRDDGGYCNGNGQWRSFPEYYLCVKLVVYKPVQHTVEVNIRDEAIEASGRSRITENYLEMLREENCGKKIGVYVHGYGEAEIADFNELNLKF